MKRGERVEALGKRKGKGGGVEEEGGPRKEREEGRRKRIRKGERKGRRGRRKRITDMETLIILPIVGAVILYFNPSKKWALLISIVILIEAIRKQIGMDRESGE